MKRLIEVYYNITEDTLLDASGNELRTVDYPKINYKEQPLLNLQLVIDNELTPYTDLTASHVLSVAIDSDFDHSTDLMCKTVASGINQPGDWWMGGDSSGGGTADITQGQVSVRLDANNANYQTKIASSEEKKNTKLELQATIGGILEQVLRFSFKCKNLIDDLGIVPPPITTSAHGTEAIGSGVDYFEVSGLAMSSIISQIFVTVRKPDSAASNVFATVREDSISNDGFIVDLSATIPASGYSLDYLALI